MPYSFNRVELIGRLGQDVDLRFTSGGQALARFSLATDRPTRPGSGSETDWHQIVCWEQLAEFAGQHLTKGRLIFVGGRLFYRSWVGRDGQRRRAAEITATEIVLLDRRPATDDPESPSQATADTSSAPDTDGPDDDVPF